MPTLRETLGTMPLGQVHALTVDQMTSFLRDKYHPTTRDEADRRIRAKMRRDIFRDEGQPHFEAMVDELFKNQKVRDLRRQFVPYALFNNVTKRIVREISTVYSEPATRTIRNANERYQVFQRTVRMDRVLRSVNRYANLLNNVLVYPDINALGVPKLRVVTPDRFVAVSHPNDPTLPVAYVIDQFPGGVEVQETQPHYLVMSDHEFFKLDRNWRFVEDTHVEHGLGRLPAILFSREELDDRILDNASGADIISAHKAVALLNVLMLKAQKSGTRMPYATGDTSRVANDQPMDEENIVQLGEGVALSTLDLGADPENYINAGRSVIKQVAANHGIPESVFDLSYQATSGFEIELKRTGLREIRRDQLLDYRPLERDLAELWAAVLTKAQHPSAYDPAGWGVNFGEVETPQDPSARLAYWKEMEGMDLANKVEMYMHQNPEASEAEAKAAIEFNARYRIAHMQRWQAANGSLFGPVGSANSPTDRDGNRLSLVEEDDAEVADAG